MFPIVTLTAADGSNLAGVEITVHSADYGDAEPAICSQGAVCRAAIPLSAGGSWTFSAAGGDFAGIEEVIDIAWWSPSYAFNDDGSLTFTFPPTGGDSPLFQLNVLPDSPDVSVYSGGTNLSSYIVPASAFEPGATYGVIMGYIDKLTSDVVQRGPRVALRLEIPLGPPGTLVATPGDQSVSVAWPVDSWVDPATEYNVSAVNLMTGATTTKLTTGSETIFTGLENGVEYGFSATTVLGTGESKPTATVLAMPITSPAAPVIASVTMGDRKADLVVVFPSSSAAPSSALDAEWEVRDSTGAVVLAPVSSKEPFFVSGLINGETYEIRARATNAVGESEWSAWSATFTPTVGLPVPALTGGDAKQGTLSIDLTLPTTAGAAATGSAWQLGTVQADNSVKWENAFPTMTGTTAVFTGLTDGVDYFVRAQSTNAAGSSPWATSAVLRPISAPAAPTVEKAVADSGTLLVDLAATSGSDARPIVGYVWKVAATTGATAGVWQSVTAASTSEGYLITSLIPGVQYDIQFAATNPAGASEWAVWSPTASPVDGSAGNGSSGADDSSDNGSAGDESGIDVPDDSDSNGADSAEPTSDELDDISTSDPDGGSGSPSSDLMSSVDSASIVSTLTGGKVGRGTADELDRGTDSTSLGATLPAHRSNVALRSILIATALLLLFLIAFGFWWLLLLARRRKKEEEDEEAAALAASLEEATAVQ